MSCACAHVELNGVGGGERLPVGRALCDLRSPVSEVEVGVQDLWPTSRGI